MKSLCIFFSMVLLASFSAVGQKIKTPRNDTIKSPEKVKEISIDKTRPVPQKLQYDFSNLNICRDLDEKTVNLPERNFSAVAPLPAINNDGSLSKISVTRQPLAGETLKMWDPGQKITVYLEPSNSTPELRQMVMNYARQWEQHANIKFEFVEKREPALIRVGFEKGQGHFSMIGRDAIWAFPFPFLNTMNFDDFANYKEEKIKATVLHEFGHALGFIHEHQSPAAGINWDKEKVYAYYALPPDNWPKEKVDVNIFQKYSATSTNFSAYDKYSIMHYYFPKYLTTDGKSFEMNLDFSATDMVYSRLLYPFRPFPGNSSGILRTGDDCDEIAFQVQYNAVPEDQVEFTLALGTKNNRNVTWWKQIAVPLTGNRETKLWVQNHSLIPAENRTTITQRIPVAEIDKTKGMAFWKAKLLGVHTLLNYKWNVWEAIPGGTRITLVWNNDSCL
jgi:serralysin